MIPRTLEKKAKLLAKKFPAIAIMGPRQAGKTTLAKHAFPNLPYVSLEQLDYRDFAENDPRGFLQQYADGAIFDEIQRVPHLFSYLQTAMDQNRKMGQYVLTGSQNFLLLENITQSLAGRVALLKLLPFSFEELHGGGFNLSTLEDYLFRGGYPRLYANRLHPEEWYPSYLQSYIERDARQIKNITDLQAFQKFMKLCAGRIGQLLNLSALASDAGITHNTAKAWLTVLEASFIIFLLPPYYRNFRKRVVKSPKLYFYDTGLACSLLGIKDKKQIAEHYAYGFLFENFVFSEFKKYMWHRGKETDLFFWRDNKGLEIDGIIETANGFIPFEIKGGKTALKEYFRAFPIWQKLMKNTRTTASVIYGGNQTMKRDFGNFIGWRDMLSHIGPHLL